MPKRNDASSLPRLIELAVLLSFPALILSLYFQGYLDRILGNTLTHWFFIIILSIVVIVESFAFAGSKTDVHFWSWLSTGFGMLGTVLGFSLALAGIDTKSLHDPASLSTEIGQFLQTVSFAIDTTMIGLSAAMIMEGMSKIREMLYGHDETAVDIKQDD